MEVKEVVTGWPIIEMVIFAFIALGKFLLGLVWSEVKALKKKNEDQDKILNDGSKQIAPELFWKQIKELKQKNEDQQKEITENGKQILLNNPADKFQKEKLGNVEETLNKVLARLDDIVGSISDLKVKVAELKPKSKN